MTRPIKHVDWSLAQAEKNGFKHFMRKGIHEQPDSVLATLRDRVDLPRGDVHGAASASTPGSARAPPRLLRRLQDKATTPRWWGATGSNGSPACPRRSSIASEVRHRRPVFFGDDLVVAISQSGETVDTLFAARTAKAAGAHVLALCNVVDSAIPRLAHGTLHPRRPEIGVASTNASPRSSPASTSSRLHLPAARRPDGRARPRALGALLKPPSNAGSARRRGRAPPIARSLVTARDVLYLGRDLGFPVALEGALKLKDLLSARGATRPAR